MLAIGLAVGAGVTGCATTGGHVAAPIKGIPVSADKPPSPNTWPRYPHFSERSCAGRPVPRGNRPGEQQAAPSYAAAPRAHPTPPAEIVQRFLARFGDRRYIRSITFPENINGRPLGAQLGAVVHGPRMSDANVSAPPNLAQILPHQIASWEATLAFGALHDDFCAAGGPTLSGLSGDGGGGWADEMDALGQRFPNPSPAAFRRRVSLVGKRFGFHVVSLRLLRPEQIAPLLIVKTSQPRSSFARNIPTILELLDPTSRAGHRTAVTFEGFFFAVEDARGPFVTTENVWRGNVEGGQWAASENLYPYAHG